MDSSSPEPLRQSSGAPDYPGRLIAVEGLDGSGKSTQIRLVKSWLEQEGYRVFFTEWNSSTLVKQATTKGKQRQLLTPTTFSLIHATDFADRYVYTAYARDAVRGVDQSWVEKVYEFARKPDITFYFRVELEVSLRRILETRAVLKYHEAGMDMRWSADPVESFKMFQSRISMEYERMRDKFGFVVMDAGRTIPEQQEEVRGIIRRKIDLRPFKHQQVPQT